MRLSEAITIYLAAGASFGVYNFLRPQNPASRFHTWLRATHAAILWPLAAARILVSRLRPGKAGHASETTEPATAQLVEKIAQAHSSLLASLYKFVERAQVSSSGKSESVELASRTVREIVEKYVELTMAAAETSLDAPPSGRELELFRVAGRRGDDLLLAGRCIHRRNIARLVVHQARARTELLQALAGIREIGTAETALMNVSAARHLSVAVVRCYVYAFDLLSLLEDESAAMSVARLLDAECMRLRRLEALSRKETRTTAEEELCTTRAHHSIIAGQSQIEVTNQG